MENIQEALNSQERMIKFRADIIKKNMRLRDLMKRLQSAQKSGNKQRMNILKLDIQLAQMDIQKFRAKIKKEQIKTNV